MQRLGKTKQACCGMVTVAMLVFSLIYIPPVQAAETSQAKLNIFLTNVLGLDLKQYDLVESSDKATFPLHYNGQVQEETVYNQLSNTKNTSRLDVISTFLDGVLVSCNFYTMKGSVRYMQLPPADILSQAKNIIRNYQVYASQNYATDTSYVQQAQVMLSNVKNLSFPRLLYGNMQLMVRQTSQYQGPEKSNLTYASIEWIHTENGTSMAQKSITLDFQNGMLTHFSDTYGLFKVGCLSKISLQQAVAIGFAVAKNYPLSLMHEDAGRYSLIPETPDWSNAAYVVDFGMVLGDYWMASAANQPTSYNGMSISPSYFPSNVTRNPLALYPLWSIEYYFSQPIGHVTGMQVQVWGDTGQVCFCTPYGVMTDVAPYPAGRGPSGYPLWATLLNQTVPTPTATPTTIMLSNDTVSTAISGSLSSSTCSYIAIGITVSVVAATSYLLFMRRRKRRQPSQKTVKLF